MTRHFHKELDKIKKRVLWLGTVVEDGVRKSVEALLHRDPVLARQVIEDDAKVDEIEVEVEEECLKVLALHQPVAVDLRFLVAVLKINNDLERVGDYAVNIAERAEFLALHEPVPLEFDFERMTRKSQDMLKRSLNALVNMDVALAREVGAADDEVDRMNREMYEIVQEEMSRRPEQIKALIHLLSVSRHLERIADLATNIAEDVVYMVKGEIVRHKAEKYR
ncbi:phosphate signaling complex protein PhoU [Candidatus Sumerlaeota bacterium]|nr:phosphate signaling complex protein PhoU [Candidatus Sumerlaeota bacterium]